MKEISRELEALLAHLARAFELPRPKLGGGPEPDWEKWWALVHEYQVGPVIAAHTTERDLPAGAHAQLFAELVRNGHEMSFRATELSRLAQALEGRCDFIVLKGGALAYSEYASAAERVVSDFDLLFDGDAALAIAKETLLQDGYRSSGRDRPGHHHVAPLHHDVRGTIFELHTNLTTPPLPARAVQQMFERKRRLHADRLPALHRLDPAAQIVHHAIHALSDPIGSALLRNLAELAWLSTRANEEIEREVVSLAAEWGVRELAAEAIDLCHRLFGSPRWLAPSDTSWRQRWAAARLTWADTWAKQRPWADRFVRHVANEHIASINRGASARSMTPLAQHTWVALRSSLSSYLEGRRPGPLVSRPEGLSWAWVGEGLLIHDVTTGAVHLLDSTSGRVFEAANDPRSPEALAEVCALDPSSVLPSVNALLERGLLHPATNPNAR